MIQFHGSLYFPTYLYSLLFISLYYFFRLKNKDNTWIHENTNNTLVLLYIILFTLLVGWRPPSGFYFGDSSTYASSFNRYALGITIYDGSQTEWFLSWLMYKCSGVMNVNNFFLIVECLYIWPVVFACRRLVPNHYLLMFIFCMGAFSFFSYGTNGMRNGMACSFVILAISLLKGNSIEKLLAVFLAFLAISTHRTTVLPVFCAVMALFIKDTRYVIGFWIASIFISLVAGNTVEAFFTGLGFDERMNQYSSQNHLHSSMFSSTGFRWDFLLYSSMPILLGYYVVVKRKIWDQNYLLLLNTYILSNAFWVMMIRAAYSNRFAYLSWFMYALVLAYPCLKFQLWKKQGEKMGWILLLHLAFTFYIFR